MSADHPQNIPEMNARERFQAIMNFQPFDRLPVIEWAPWWDDTLKRWYTEGLPSHLTEYADICRHFDLEVYQQHWFWEFTSECPKPAYHGAPLIETAEDYDKIKKHLYPLPAVNRQKWDRMCEEQQKGDAVIWFTVNGFFWVPRTLFGIEPHFYTFYDDPELMHRINSDLTEWILTIIDELSTFAQPDFMTFAEDMSYNNGPMLSKELYSEFMHPYYQKIVPALKKLGTIPLIDSDGDVTMPADWFNESGLDGILPLERQAGLDLAQLRETHPKMKFLGHFDKMTMTKGEDAMREEFERLLPIAAKGGFVVGVDHQTPPGVSLKQFESYLKLFREYADKAGKLSQEVLAVTPG
jgi:hypothetical protein